MGLFGGPKVSVGLDIGNSWIKMVQMTLSSGGRPQVTRFACEKRFDDPRSAVAKIFKENSLKPTCVVVSLDGQDTEMMVRDFPAKSLNEANRQAELAMKEFDISNFNINYSVLRGPCAGSDGSQVFPVLYVSAEKFKVNQFMSNLNVPGIRTEDLIVDIDLLAAINALELDQASAGTVCLVEGGATTTNVSIHRDGILRFTNTIKDDGGAVITNHIAQELNISAEEAEKMKIENGISASGGSSIFGSTVEFDDPLKPDSGAAAGSSSDSYLNVFKTELERYFDKIIHVIKDYEEQNNDKIREILITGGLACIKNVDGFMINYFKNSGLTAGNISIPHSPYLEMLTCPSEEKHAYTVAVGLALRGLAE